MGITISVYAILKPPGRVITVARIRRLCVYITMYILNTTFTIWVDSVHSEPNTPGVRRVLGRDVGGRPR